MTGSTVVVRPLDTTDPVAYAARELEEYLETMTDRAVSVEQGETYDPAADALWLGTAGAFREETDLAGESPADALPAVEDPAFDDAIHVDTDGATGVVVGSNPRSVLVGAYRLLKEQGCRWIRPGADGEMIPEIDGLAPIAVTEAASSRHRGVTIEGVVDYGHVQEMIDWLPKVGYNSYFLQFFEAYPFFKRWHDHGNNPFVDPEPFDRERSLELHEACVEEIEKRGLTYHAVGHGWQAAAVDLPASRFNETVADEDIPAEARQYLAELDGERRLARDMPMRTELCYANEEARRRFVEEVLAYAADHPEVDVLHCWLSDNLNNHCECEDCRGVRPADQYVRLLNEIDAALTGAGIDAKVAFLLYNDLLWPPIEETFENPDRFLLMFAPSDRSYLEDFGDLDSGGAGWSGESGEPTEIPPFERNELDPPADLEANVDFLRAWQEVFDGDGFVFDYHLMWNHGPDPGFVTLTETIGADVRHIDDLGLSGTLSCQLHRAFFPTGTPNYVMGHALWDDEATTTDLLAEYAGAAFGADGEPVLAYLRALSEAFEPLLSWEHSDMWGELDVDAGVAESFARVPEIVGEFRPVLERNRDHDEPARELSWLLLEMHADVVEALGPALAAKARGDDEEARQRWRDLRAHVQRREGTYHRAFDVYWFVEDMDNTFGISEEGAP